MNKFIKYTEVRSQHWDTVATKLANWQGQGKAYHRRLTEVYQLMIPKGMRVLELGCGQGDLLAALSPSRGVGIDFSATMVKNASARHPGLEFHLGDAHDCDLGETFDFIILSDLVNDLWDVQTVFHNVHRHCTPDTRIIINAYSRLWQGPLRMAQRLGLAIPLMEQNWLTVHDITDLLYLEDLEVVKHVEEVLLPLPLWPISQICNSFLVKLSPFRTLALTNVIVARPSPKRKDTPPPTVTVVIPARNESGNIRGLLEQTPEMGGGTEIIFVEGNSSDDTWEMIEKLLPEYSHRNCKLLKQPGKGKGDAVRTGFAAATGDILMILDADMTVPPHDLPRFYEALVSGKGEFINGVRLVYPMEDKAMRFLNLLGNKFFSLAFSWLLGQQIKDTLCGTKVLYRKDYEQLVANRAYFGEFDPFGDFDLIFGAARMNMKIVDVPVRYRERIYGDTNIQRFRHGLLLLRMVLFAARKIKFV
jgi:ubiquinone/menaquinone biosynthesis C-methylase UbiE